MRTRSLFAAAVVLISLVIYSAVIPSVYGQGELHRWETDLAKEWHDVALASPWVVLLFTGVTATGSIPFIAVIGLVIATMLFWRRNWPMLIGWLTALGGGGLLYAVLKSVFQRPRPTFADPIVVEHTTGFPSGHCLGAVVCFGFLAYMFFSVQTTPWKKGAAVRGLFVWVLAIGFSRLFLGAHYLTDVVGAYSVGTIWLVASIGATESLPRGATSDAGPMAISK